MDMGLSLECHGSLLCLFLQILDTIVKTIQTYQNLLRILKLDILYISLLILFFFNKFIYLFIFGCVGSSFLCKGFLQLRQVGATLHRGALASHCRGLSLRSTGSRRAGSVVVAHGASCSAACGTFPAQGSNPCPLQWQADSQPLRHQGSPLIILDVNLVVF